MVSCSVPLLDVVAEIFLQNIVITNIRDLAYLNLKKKKSTEIMHSMVVVVEGRRGWVWTLDLSGGATDINHRYDMGDNASVV